MKREFISSSIFLFADNLLISVAGWLFWFVVSKYATTSDVGISTYFFTFSAFLSGLIMLGLEFSLVKIPELSQAPGKSQEYQLRKLSFGSIFTFEIIANIIMMPLIFIYLSESHLTHDYSYIVCTLLIFIFTSISTVSKYALMGIMATKQILVVDAISICARFFCSLYLLLQGQGAFAILFATVIQNMILSLILTWIFIRRVGFSFSRSVLRPLLRDGLSNFPGKVSKMMIAPISVILLGAIGMDPASMGLFFISLIVTVVAATFGTSLSTISLSSVHRDKEVMFQSLKFGIALTAPLVTLLVVFPAPVLAIVNEDYVSGSGVLTILSYSIIPSVVVFNVITRLNSVGDNKRLIILGLLELIVFLVFFVILVPELGIFGAAIAILIAYLVSGALAFRWIEPYERVFIGKSVISIIVGIISALILKPVLGDVVTIPLSIVTTIAINHFLGVLRFNEIKEIGLSALKNK